MPVILHCTPDGIECTTDIDSHMPILIVTPHLKHQKLYTL